MKKILAIVLALIVAMALTVTVFAGASSGYYTGTLNVGLASLPCTLNIGSSVATATITQDSTYNDFTIPVAAFLPHQMEITEQGTVFQLRYQMVAAHGGMYMPHILHIDQIHIMGA